MTRPYRSGLVRQDPIIELIVLNIITNCFSPLNDYFAAHVHVSLSARVLISVDWLKTILQLVLDSYSFIHANKKHEENIGR